MKKVVLVLLLVAVLMLSAACNKNAENVSGKKIVYTTIYPLYDFTQKIAGNKLSVKNIIPPGVEPHEWEPTTKNVAEMSNASLVLYIGLDLDSWAVKAQNGSQTKFINVSKGVPLIKEGNAINPHIWLSPSRAIIIARNIKDALISIDNKNKAYYEKNYENIKNQLQKLNKDYSEELKNTSKKSFIVYHSAFDYLAQDYGLKQISLTGLSDEQEPSPSRVAYVMDYIKKNKIKYIFTEPLTSPKAIKTIAADTHVQVLPLNTIEGLTQSEIKEGKDYFSLMRENLNNLKKALE
ncbi:zinc transport system substrate-binding protein [Caldanaerobius fijiensis DSM 17918]|uniref:Zinc transport system substrate-binding protein n=1 Tax=Caldanaerobius fijiensis DSM 17918 TaxID=1121256 RepID=A0A1M4T6Z1_9THEO|nr:metal ABC transporter substrate-binding protein [Caldanaerobius fijiensis]SHE40124.1 zinc transport system substrate-binding protein [Caldanaerobius fijiensis DSM 17918]